MNDVTVCVTELEYYKGRSVFDRATEQGVHCVCAPAEESGLAKEIVATNARHVIVGVDRYVGPLYEALPQGGVIARFGVGHDGIDKEKAAAKGLLCTNTPGVLDDSVAEHTIALMLSVARNIAAHDAELVAGKWLPRTGMELRDRTLAVIGCGPIGRRVTSIASSGFGMRVVGCEIAPVDAVELRDRYGFASLTPTFEEAVADADFVSLHLPAVPATRHFIDAPRLETIPAQVWLVNTARGMLVDESALYEALAANMLAGAALDVFEKEPYEPVYPERDLRLLPNTILTPHIGSSTTQACVRMAERALTNIALAETGDISHMDTVSAAKTD